MLTETMLQITLMNIELIFIRSAMLVGEILRIESKQKYFDKEKLI